MQTSASSQYRQESTPGAKSLLEADVRRTVHSSLHQYSWARIRRQSLDDSVLRRCSCLSHHPRYLLSSRCSVEGYYFLDLKLRIANYALPSPLQAHWSDIQHGSQKACEETGYLGPPWPRVVSAVGWLDCRHIWGLLTARVAFARQSNPSPPVGCSSDAGSDSSSGIGSVTISEGSPAEEDIADGASDTGSTTPRARSSQEPRASRAETFQEAISLDEVSQQGNKRRRSPPVTPRGQCSQEGRTKRRQEDKNPVTARASHSNILGSFRYLQLRR